MNKKNKIISGGVAFLLATATLVSCTNFDTLDFHADRPQNNIDQAALNAYSNLNSYIKRTQQPDFKLGAEITLKDAVDNNLLYRLVKDNFDEANITRGFNHLSFVQESGTVTLGTFQQFLDAHGKTEQSAHIGHLLWHEQQRSAYLKGLIADIVIPGESGKDVVANFENNSLGDSYPMNNGGSSSVVNDPTAESGKSLRVIGAQTFPQFQVNLPEGRTLADYKTVILDFKGAGCCGFYGGGMRMAISTSVGPVTITNYSTGPSGFGISDNVWGRGKIILSLSNLNLSTAQKELTNFVLTVGSGTGSADYLIDNVTMTWEKAGQIIVKSPEEKKQIITGELEKWIKGIADMSKDRIASWSVAYQPMDDTNPANIRTGAGIDPMPANTFYWGDYLGKEYVATAIQMLRANGNSTKAFITETGLLGNTPKIHGLADFISFTESKGVTVDGIATELALDIASDKTQLEELLSGLASTGKLIKISALDIGIGTVVANANAQLYRDQADMYKWFVQAYFRLIPASQRAGITFRSPIDQPNGSTWRPNEPVGLWTNTAGYLRKLSYQSVIEALENNN